MASIFCWEYFEVEEMIFELVGVLVDEAALKVWKEHFLNINLICCVFLLLLYY